MGELPTELDALLPDPSGGLCGYLHVCGEDFALRVCHGGASAPATFDACPKLRAALAGHEGPLLRRLHQCTDAWCFVSELRELLQRQLAALPPRALPASAFYELIISELDSLGWSALESVSADLDVLRLRVADAAARDHSLELRLPPRYPAAPPVARVSLPSPFELEWPEASSRRTLAAAAEQFRAALHRHQTLWDQLDDIDAHAWVLEPSKPTRAEVSRRIALGGHCSLQLCLHAESPGALPELHFLGAERRLAPLRRALNANLLLWDPKDKVRLNLQRLLGVEVPSPEAASASADEYSIECAICYCYRLEEGGAVPDVNCDGCSKPFHQGCLVEWLQALPTTQQSFNRLFGECPYCSRDLSVEIPRGT